MLWSQKQELDEFAELEALGGLLSLLKQNAGVCASLLCFDENATFRPEEFEKCLIQPMQDPGDSVQEQTYRQFNSYINENPTLRNGAYRFASPAKSRVP